MKTILTTLLLIATTPSFAGVIYKCENNGKTIYTESPCKKNAYQENVFPVIDDRVGTVSPNRQTIEQTRAKIRNEMNQSGPVVSTGSVPRDSGKCESINKTIAYLDGRSRMALSGWEQDRVREEKRQAQKALADWNC